MSSPVNAVGVSDVLQASMAYQRKRLEAAAYNVAHANVALPPGSTAEFASATGTQHTRLALEPGNPAADEHGIVRYPDVDLATEMTTMMSASRHYEASLRAYNILKSMNAKALELGK